MEGNVKKLQKQIGLTMEAQSSIEITTTVTLMSSFLRNP